MKGKHLILISALALIIVSCVIAAGCTSQQNADDPIIGPWGGMNTENDFGTSIVKFYANGTGTEHMLYPIGMDDNYMFTWKKTGDKTYEVTYSDGSVWEATITDDEQPLVWKLITNKDKIIGTWPNVYYENGEVISDLTTFNPDYTGTSVGTYIDDPGKEKLIQTFTWEKVGKNIYFVTYDDNYSNWYVYYDPINEVIGFSEVNYANEPIVGIQTEDETEFIVDGTTTYLFAANGTGKEIQRSETGIVLGTYAFRWAPIGDKRYILSYQSSTSEEAWNVGYNPQTKSLENWEFLQYSWYDNYREDGNHLLDMHYVKNGSSTAYEFDGNGVMNAYGTTWEPIGLHQFKVTYVDDGDLWYVTYLPATDTYKWVHAEK